MRAVLLGGRARIDALGESVSALETTLEREPSATLRMSTDAAAVKAVALAISAATRARGRVAGGGSLGGARRAAPHRVVHAAAPCSNEAAEKIGLHRGAGRRV